jgi:hypothetical protein
MSAIRSRITGASSWRTAVAGRVSPASHAVNVRKIPYTIIETAIVYRSEVAMFQTSCTAGLFDSTFTRLSTTSLPATRRTSSATRPIAMNDQPILRRTRRRQPAASQRAIPQRPIAMIVSPIDRLLTPFAMS